MAVGVTSGMAGGVPDPMKPVRCGRCDFKGTREERDQHAIEAGHPLCAICSSRSLRSSEVAVCDPCVARTRDELDAIVATVIDDAPTMIAYSGYYGMFGADLLVMTADGSIEGGGPDDWLTDPTPVIAILEANERDWRRHFAEPPAEDVATVTSCAAYLRRNLGRAAAEHPAFDEFVTEIRTLHSRLLHTAGLIDDPERAPAECFTCGGRLVRVYRPLKSDPHHRLERIKHKVNTSATRRKRPTSAKERRAMVLAAVAGREQEGLTDKLQCSNCGTTYTFAQYGLALRSKADSLEGWVEVQLAADASRRPVRTIRTWMASLQVSSSCRVEDRRQFVWWPDVATEAERAAQRQRHAKDQRERLTG